MQYNAIERKIFEDFLSIQNVPRVIQKKKKKRCTASLKNATTASFNVSQRGLNTATVQMNDGYLNMIYFTRFHFHCVRGIEQSINNIKAKSVGGHYWRALKASL